MFNLLKFRDWWPDTTSQPRSMELWSSTLLLEIHQTSKWSPVSWKKSQSGYKHRSIWGQQYSSVGTHCPPFLLATKREPVSSRWLQYSALSMGYHWVTLKTDCLFGQDFPEQLCLAETMKKRLLVTGSSWAQKTKISQKPDHVHLVHWRKQPKLSGLRANSLASSGFTSTHPHVYIHWSAYFSCCLGRKEERGCC